MSKNLFLILSLSLLMLACSRSEITVNVLNDTCRNGILDDGEFAVDCGGECSSDCGSVRLLKGELYGRIRLDRRYDYVISEPFVIRDGAELEIPAGTTLRVIPNKGVYIAVTQGGKLYAYGREDDPVLITSNSENPSSGDWGGIIFCGTAPIGGDTVGRSALGDYFYGGSDSTTTSGVLRYVKLQYAGAKYDENTYFDALSLYGVGSYTQMDHLFIEDSAGNGLGLYGGLPTVNDLVVKDAKISGIAISEEWQGEGNRWTIHESGVQNLILSGHKVGNDASCGISELIIQGSTSSKGILFVEGGVQGHFERVGISKVETGLYIEDDPSYDNITNGNFTMNGLQLESVGQDVNMLGIIPDYITVDSQSPEYSYDLPEWTSLWK